MRKDYFEFNYPLRIRIVFISIMMFLITLFYFFPRIIESKIIIEESEYTEILKVELITPIQQQQQFKSARPAIPIEADEDSEIDTLDFMDTDIEGFDSWAVAPVKTKKRARTFQAYNKPPKPKNPTALAPRYPEICRSAGIEGTVIIEFFIDESGNVDHSSISVIGSVPCLDQICIDAIKKSRWKPAQQDQDKVPVWVTKNFKFTLEKTN